MTQVNYILYHESFYAKELVRNAFTKHFSDSLIYEIREMDRLLNGLVSSYFHFVIFALDKYNEKTVEMLKKVLPYKNNIPFIIIANEYDLNCPLLKSEGSNPRQIFYLDLSELEDLPGISLRILHNQNYFHRKSERKKTVLKMTMSEPTNQEVQVQVKNISSGGLKFYSRKNFDNKIITNLCHKNLRGQKIHIPVEIVWKKLGQDGRWIYGARYLKSRANNHL